MADYVRPQPALTERIVQDCLYWWTLRKGHKWQAPNVYVFDWESDLLTVTKALCVHEFEIKISRSDFKADARKVGKHDIVSTGSRPLSEREQYSSLYYQANNIGRVTGARPNYFWYVCPEGTVSAEDVPPHAGLITIKWNAAMHWYELGSVLKQAPRAHKEPLTTKYLAKLLNCIYFRYWRLRRATRPDDLAAIEQAYVGEVSYDTTPDVLTTVD